MNNIISFFFGTAFGIVATTILIVRLGRKQVTKLRNYMDDVSQNTDSPLITDQSKDTFEHE